MTRVFAHGSLALRPGARPARLAGVRRAWAVAMDNAVDLADYKHYEAADGTRPPVLVAFLDLVAAPGQAVDGVLLEDADLEQLDRRERNYLRTRVVLEDGTDAWTYTGRPDARERAARGRRHGTLRVARAYLEVVSAALGDAVPAPSCPVEELRRVDHRS